MPNPLLCNFQPETLLVIGSGFLNPELNTRLSCCREKHRGILAISPEFGCSCDHRVQYYFAGKGRTTVFDVTPMARNFGVGKNEGLVPRRRASGLSLGFQPKESTDPATHPERWALCAVLDYPFWRPQTIVLVLILVQRNKEFSFSSPGRTKFRQIRRDSYAVENDGLVPRRGFSA
jgi:hypothetical protein